MNTYPTTPMAYVQIPLAEIKENDYDLFIYRYKEIVYKEVENNVPFEILNQIVNLNSKRLELSNLLKSSL